MSQSEFLGRHEALRRLRAAAADAREGVPCVLVIQGMPGVGKTTLLRHFLAENTDFSLMAASAVPEERNRPFALLDRLTVRVDQGPGVSRSPGLASGAPEDRTPLNAGADVLRLIDDERRHGPLAVIVDDADWADPMSVRALAFALRRLWRDRVLTLIALRNWPPDWDESAVQALEGIQPFSRLTLGGFSRADIARMAVAVRGRPLSPDACERLLRRTQGHPLYVRTLLAELPAGWEDGPVDAFPMPADLSAAVMRQVAALPPTGRQFLEALSVLEGAAPLHLLASITGVRDAATALDGPVRAGLVDRPVDRVDPAGPVTFRHALQKEAVRQSLPPVLRRRLHLAAAAVLDEQAALIHQVAAADGPDPVLAERLRELSVREAGESRLVAAATHLLWAAQVVDAGQRDGEFLFRAVRLLFWAGMDAELLRHRTEVLESRPSPLRDESRALLEFAMGRPVRARPLLTRARNGLLPGTRVEDRVAIDTELAAVSALIGDGAETERMAQAALDAAATPVLPPGRPSPGPYGTGKPPGLLGTARGFVAYGRALTSGTLDGLSTLAFLPERPDEVSEEDLPGLVYRGILRGAAGQYGECTADLTTAMARARPDSVRILGLSSRIHLCICHFMSGNWALAARDAEIGLTMVETRGRSFDRAVLHSLASTVAAAQGEWRNAERDLNRAIEEARGLDYEGAYFQLSVARAALARCRGEADGVLDALRRITTGAAYSERSLVFSAWWRPLHIEALVDSDRLAEARQAYALLIPDPASVDRRNGALTVARAWLGGRIRQAEGDLRGALACYASVTTPAGDRQDAPLYRALLQQAHGSCLAASGETEPAVAQLRMAEKIFAALGAAPFLDRCRADITALAGAAPGEDGTPLADLTAREREVARLVGRGHTNREIAAALFLSAKTIEYHLRNVFAKTRVHNRRELRDLVQDAPWEKQ